MTGFWKKIVSYAGILFLFCFLCVGYADVTDVLDINGMVHATPQNGVFITDVASVENMTVFGYVGTILNSRVDLSNTGTVTVDITVYNNTSVVYGYNITKYAVATETFDNENIRVTTVMEKKHPDWVVQPGGYLTFPVTYSYVDGASTANPILNSVIEFEFLPYDEIPDNDDETTVSNAMDRFKEILNNPEEEAALREYMNNPPIFDRNSTYISNVPGAKNQDINAIEELFAGNLHININGEQTDVKIMIKKENISNSYSGDEMVIYMTTDPLNQRGTAVVYRCVYADNGEEWIEYSQMQEGTATICDYTWGSSYGTGSFNTNTWKAS